MRTLARALWVALLVDSLPSSGCRVAAAAAQPRPAPPYRVWASPGNFTGSAAQMRARFPGVNLLLSPHPTCEATDVPRYLAA
eukprot:SAG31_NODE_32213_length_358_cov_1.193050_1_plen_81_part_01